MEGKIKLKTFQNTPYGVELEFNKWIDEMNENGGIIIHSTQQCYLNDSNGGRIAFSVLYFEATELKKRRDGRAHGVDLK